MNLRPLTTWERALSRSVFGAALETERVRLVFHRTPFAFAVTLGRFVLMTVEPIADFTGEPMEMQAWLIHELTHVHQFQSAPLGTLRSWARVVLSGGYLPGLRGYRYALPAAWMRLNLEQQAAAVEDVFRLSHGLSVRHGPRGARPGDYAGLTPFPITESL
jgi:hypothetical protein